MHATTPRKGRWKRCIFLEKTFKPKIGAQQNYKEIGNDLNIDTSISEPSQQTLINNNRDLSPVKRGNNGESSTSTSEMIWNEKGHTNGNSNGSKIKIIMFNARSLMNKLPQLEILSHLQEPDIILITETWANSSVNDAELSLKGYGLMRSDRNTGRGGGCILYYKEHIQITEYHENTRNTKGIQSIWAELVIRDKKIVIGLIYNSPNSSESEINAMIEDVYQRAEKKQPTTALWGLQLPTHKLEDITRRPKRTAVSGLHAELIFATNGNRVYQRGEYS